MKTWQIYAPFAVFLVAATIMVTIWLVKGERVKEDKYPGADPIVEPEPVKARGVCVETMDGKTNHYPKGTHIPVDGEFLSVLGPATMTRSGRLLAVYSAVSVKVAYGGPCRETP